MKKTHEQNHFHCVDDDECEEFEHCFCPEHASYVQSRFHEVLLDFFSAHNFEGCPEHGISCEHFYDKKIFKDINRERFAADWGSVRTGIRSDGELKYSVGKVPQQLSRPKVTLLPDKPSESSHPGVVISWAKKTPRVDIIQYFLELRIQNCEELDSWVLIYQGTDKQFTCTRLPRGAKCCFRVQGENENGKGKWSEESVIVVPGTPINSNSSSHTESTQSKRKKKRKRKKAPAQSAFQLRAELTELLNCPATEPLESFIRRVKEIDPFSAELQGVLEDARTALEIKVEEVALRSQLSRTRRQKIEEELLWAQAKGNSQQLEDCIERARQEGISIQQAEKTLRQLGRVTAVRARLQEALSSNNIDQLETAIEMAEQWENSQLHCEIQACTDKIRQLSVPADEYSRIEKPTLPTASSDTKESSSFSSGKSFQAKDFRVTEEDKQNVLSQLKALSRRPEKEISQSDLVKAIHCAAPWATEHPFIEFISEFNQRIQLQQEITFGKKLLEAALLSENVEEIVRCLQQVLHMKNFGLENEIRLCSQTLERMHIMELKHLLKQYCSNPQSVPDIQQLLQQAMIYQDVLKKEIITAQDQLRTVHSHHSHSCSDHHSHHRCRHRL